MSDNSKMVGRCFRTTGGEFMCTAVYPGEEDGALSLYDDNSGAMRLHLRSETPHEVVERELRVIGKVSPELHIDFPNEMRTIGEVFLRSAGQEDAVLDGYVCRELKGTPIATLSREVLDNGTHRAAIASGFRAIILALLEEDMLPTFALSSPVDPESEGHRALERFVGNILYDADTHRTTLVAFNGVVDGSNVSGLSAQERAVLIEDMSDDFWAYLDTL